MKPKKLRVTLQDNEADRYRRMFESACIALGEVGDALGCDPDEGGAEPLLFEIAKLKERLDAYMQRSVELAGMYNTLLNSESIDEQVRQISLHRDHVLMVNEKLRAQRHGDWEPIETAPKGANGFAWMLLAWGEDWDVSCASGFRHGDKFFASGTFFCIGKERRYELREVEIKPTHWMPLPYYPRENEDDN